jgi:hypothetical protein
LDLEWLTKAATVRGQFVVDDLQVDNQDAGDQEPPMAGALLGLDLFAPAPLLTRSRYLALEFCEVTNRVYNTSRAQERYTYYGKGLAEPQNDFQYGSVAIVFFPARAVQSNVMLKIRRQGEGRINGYWGDTSSGNLGFRSENTPTGIVHSSYQILTEQRYRPRYDVGVTLRLGYEAERNVDHQRGQNRDGVLFWLKFEAAWSRFFPVKADQTL